MLALARRYARAQGVRNRPAEDDLRDGAFPPATSFHAFDDIRTKEIPVKRPLHLAYGIVAYVAFLATILYAIGFVGGFLVPKTLDGPRTLPLWQALAIDAGLLTLFAVQHSGMARPAFKRWWRDWFPESLERSTYVLLASLALAALFAAWQPLGGPVWTIEGKVAATTLHALSALGWAIVVASTFAIDHFDLFGLRQSYAGYRNRAYTPVAFAMPRPYRHVRHPLYVGFLLAFWSAPVMTVSHLVFAVATTAYILIAIQLEEADLVDAHPEYAAYRREVPMLVPRIRAASLTPRA